MEYLYSIISKKANYGVALLNKVTYSDTPPLTSTCPGQICSLFK